ncbi:MAG: response regulator [gamma proteobacterium symbiont of Taylorina sp.]|nr:response regulator [gamma proteobacterium symbiont of Taylorina sp.]
MIDKKALREKVRPLKLLYVEDEAPLREQGEIFFKKFFNTVASARNGEEGLSLFKASALSHPFDVIISDIKMPKMYGDIMLNKILEISDANKHTIFSTILTATIEEREINGIYDLFLLKPVEFEQMFELLQQIEAKFQL